MSLHIPMLAHETYDYYLIPQRSDNTLYSKEGDLNLGSWQEELIWIIKANHKCNMCFAYVSLCETGVWRQTSKGEDVKTEQRLKWCSPSLGISMPPLKRDAAELDSFLQSTEGIRPYQILDLCPPKLWPGKFVTFSHRVCNNLLMTASENYFSILQGHIWIANYKKGSKLTLWFCCCPPPPKRTFFLHGTGGFHGRSFFSWKSSQRKNY